MQHLDERDPHDPPLQRCDPVDRPPLRVASDQLVEVGGVVLRRVGQRAGELRGVALEDVVELLPGDGVLVEGEGGAAALVRPAAHARDMYSPVAVWTFTRSPMFTNSGTCTVAPVSSVAGLLPPPDAVSPRTPGSVWVTSSSTEAGSWIVDGLPSMNTTSTSSLGLVQRSVSFSAPAGTASCS